MASSLNEVQHLMKDMCNALSICNDHLGYYCNLTDSGTRTICRNRCADIKCSGDRGVCIITSGQPICRCRSYKNILYSGKNCEIKTERLALESKYIAAISGTCGGILLLIVVVVVIWACRNRRTYKQDSYKDSDAGSRSMPLHGFSHPVYGNDPTRHGNDYSDMKEKSKSRSSMRESEFPKSFNLPRASSDSQGVRTDNLYMSISGSHDAYAASHLHGQRDRGDASTTYLHGQRDKDDASMTYLHAINEKSNSGMYRGRPGEQDPGVRGDQGGNYGRTGNISPTGDASVPDYDSQPETSFSGDIGGPQSWHQMAEQMQKRYM